MKKIGIIGGAGPMASCFLYKFIIEHCQTKFGCVNDEDFPEIILISYPFMSSLEVQESEQNKIIIIKQIQNCVDKLNKCNVDLLAIACNTLHSFLKEINLGNLKLIHIAQESLKVAEEKKIKKIFLLATPTTIKSGFYNNQNIKLFYPEDSSQKKVNQIIDKVLAGTFNKSDSDFIKDFLNKEHEKLAFDGVILGCTEFGVLNDKYPINPAGDKYVILDSLRILAEKISGSAF